MSAQCQLCFSDCLFKLSMRPPALALAGWECPHYQEAPQGAHGACPHDSERASGCQSRRPSGTTRQGSTGPGHCQWHASWVSVLTIRKGPAAVRSRSRCRLARLGRESGPFTRRSCTPMLHRQEPTGTCAMMQCATAGAMRAPDIPQLRRWVCHEVTPALRLASRSTRRRSTIGASSAELGCRASTP
jgi:hypothetical protein